MADLEQVMECILKSVQDTKLGWKQLYMQGWDCHPEGPGQWGWTLCSLGRRNGQPRPWLEDSGSDFGRAGSRSGGKGIGCEWAASWAGARPVPRQHRDPGLLWVGHSTGCQGMVRWSALLSMHQAPRALSSIWGPIQKWSCQTRGAQGRPARALPCKEVLAALQRVSVFELLFLSFLFVLACLLFFWKAMSTLPRKQTMVQFDLHCFCELASSCSVRSDQAPNMSFLVVALALKTKPKREGNSRSINQSYTHTWKDSGEMRKWHAISSVSVSMSWSVFGNPYPISETQQPPFVHHKEHPCQGFT